MDITESANKRDAKFVVCKRMNRAIPSASILSQIHHVLAGLGRLPSPSHEYRVEWVRLTTRLPSLGPERTD